jgi:exodeoxyribonuclease VII large subunit
MNDTLAATHAMVTVVGEVSGYKEWNGRLVFFDLKDEEAVVNCMIPLGMLRAPVEDGMRIRVHAAVKLTQKGRFTLNVKRVEPVGEGQLQRQFELLKAKLEREGLFAPERKRTPAAFPRRIAVVTSLESAAYRDFRKTLDARWGGVEIIAAHTQVQGETAPEGIAAAIAYIDQLSPGVDVLVVTRGGGGLEDLAAFNSEKVVRAVAGSRAPTVVGVGHETDVSLSDMAADVRAATPTDIARHIVPDRRELRASLGRDRRVMAGSITGYIARRRTWLNQRVAAMERAIDIPRYMERVTRSKTMLARQQQQLLAKQREHLAGLGRTLGSYDPDAVLRRGYALVRRQQALIREAGRVSVGEQVVIQLAQGQLEAEVVDVRAEEDTSQ